jgi:hypothetical protein
LHAANRRNDSVLNNRTVSLSSDLAKLPLIGVNASLEGLRRQPVTLPLPNRSCEPHDCQRDYKWTSHQLEPCTQLLQSGCSYPSLILFVPSLRSGAVLNHYGILYSMKYQYSMEYYIPWNTVLYRILIPIQYNTGNSISVEYNTGNSVFRPALVPTRRSQPLLYREAIFPVRSVRRFDQLVRRGLRPRNVRR